MSILDIMKGSKIFSSMADLNVYETSKGNLVVSAREEHKLLGVGKDYTTWIKGRIDKYGFAEGVDFVPKWVDPKMGDVVNFEGNVNAMVKKGFFIDHIIKLDMAKELAMVENNEKGREVRKYFIECERKLIEILKNPALSEKEKCIIGIYNGGSDAVYSAKRLSEIEAKEAEDKLMLTVVEPLKKELEEDRKTIKGLCGGFTLAEKRQRIIQIVRKGSKQYSKAFNILYKEFEMKEHIDLDRRLVSKEIVAIKPKIKNKMDLIEHLGKIDSLFEITCILYKTDAEKILKSLLEIK